MLGIFASGVLKGVPAVVLGLTLAWLLLRWNFRLESRGMMWRWRMCLLCLIGLICCFVITLVTFSLYDYRLHPVVMMMLIPFVTFCYIWMFRASSENYRPKYKWIPLVLILTACVVVLCEFGMYPMEAGENIHGNLVIIIWVIYAAMTLYLTVASDKNGIKPAGMSIKKDKISDFLILGITFLLDYGCWVIIHAWKGYPSYLNV